MDGVYRAARPRYSAILAPDVPRARPCCAKRSSRVCGLFCSWPSAPRDRLSARAAGVAAGPPEMHAFGLRLGGRAGLADWRLRLDLASCSPEAVAGVLGECVPRRLRQWQRFAGLQGCRKLNRPAVALPAPTLGQVAPRPAGDQRLARRACCGRAGGRTWRDL